ncbi:MAG: hypothetical protein GTO13_14435 [Proteobacteria bacterium]|nr:hypothetical protein [Pseudomonadota bacterium]
MGPQKILCVSIVFSFTLCFFPSQAQDQVLDVEYNQGSLSVSAKNANLQKALAIVAEKTGVLVNIPKGLGKSITIQFDRVPLEEGLHRILRDTSYALVFSPSDEKDGAGIVSGVFVLSGETKGSRTSKTTRSEAIRPLTKKEREDAILERYESQLDKLEEQMEMVEEASARGRRIRSQILRLEKQIERLLQKQEAQEFE